MILNPTLTVICDPALDTQSRTPLGRSIHSTKSKMKSVFNCREDYSKLRKKSIADQGRRALNLKHRLVTLTETSVNPAASRRLPKVVGSTRTMVSQRCMRWNVRL